MRVVHRYWHHSLLQGNLIPFDLFATVAAELKQACIVQQGHKAKLEPECVPLGPPKWKRYL